VRGMLNGREANVKPSKPAGSVFFNFYVMKKY
jgi:hypothetical protein